jgi:alpha-tubulin suppressor-like RCC1 family protein
MPTTQQTQPNKTKPPPILALTLSLILSITIPHPTSQSLSITSISPTSGPTAGGTAITITGQDFAATPAIRQVAASELNIFILQESGALYGIGTNSSGQIGNGTTTTVRYDSPSLVNGHGDITIDTKITQVTSPYLATAAIDDAGNLYTWGLNNYYITGQGTNSGSQLTPKKVNGNGGSITETTHITQVVCAQAHTDSWGYRGSCLALDSTGNIHAWDDNAYSQLGDTTTTTRPKPIQLPEFTPNPITQISHAAASINAGDIGNSPTFSLALDSTGQVYSWGSNNWGQLGINSTTNQPSPTQNPHLQNITTINSAHGTAYAITATGQLYAWGRNDYHWSSGQGQVGNNTTTASVLSPTLINTDTTGSAITSSTAITAVAGGFGTSYAIDSTGTAYGWGGNRYSGHFGNNDTTQKLVPIKLNGITTSSLLTSQTIVTGLSSNSPTAFHATVFITNTNELIYYGASGDVHPNLGYANTNIPYGLDLTALPKNVFLDTSPCTVTLWTDTEIHCTTTAHPEGQVDLSVNGTIYPTAYTYTDLYLNYSITPTSILLDISAPNILTLTPVSATQSISVSTNHTSGYTLTLELATGQDPDLHSPTIPSASIPATTCQFSAPCPLTTNTDGLSLDSTNFFRPPPKDSPITISSSSSPTTQTTTITYATKVNTSTPPSTYTTTLLYTITATSP